MPLSVGANRKVLTRIDAPLDETVPAKRSITARDLLTSTFGFGARVSGKTFEAFLRERVFEPQGTWGRERLLSQRSIESMTIDQLTPAQKQVPEYFSASTAVGVLAWRSTYIERNRGMCQADSAGTAVSAPRRTQMRRTT
jgi:hypothetical protein